MLVSALATIQAPSPTSTPTGMPTATLSPSPTPSPTDTPTATPPAAWQDAYTFQRNGDYDRAIQAYQALLNTQPADDQVHAAMFHLGQTYFLASNYAEVVRTLELFLQNYAQDELAHRAYLLLGASHQAWGDQLATGQRQGEAEAHWEAAAAAFTAYRDRGGPLVDYADVRLGQLFYNLGRTSDAIAAFQHALASGTGGLAAVDALKGLGRAYLSQRDFAEASAAFQKAIGFTDDRAQQAELSLAAGQAYASFGQTEQAVAQFRAVVTQYSDTPAAPRALQELAALGETGISFYLQGMVYYNNKDYQGAISAFKRVGEGHADSAAAHFYMGEAYRRLGNHAQAIQEFDTLINHYPQDRRVTRAIMNKGRSLRGLDQDAQAIQVFHSLAETFPNDPLADDALWVAALLTEESVGCDQALAAYLAVGQRYPKSEFAGRAYWRAGICRFKLGRYEEAIAAWQPMAALEDPQARSQGLFWLAKANLAMGKQEEGEQLMAKAATTAPTSYYGARAIQLRDPDLKTMPLAPGPGTQADFEGWLLARTGRSAANLQNVDAAILGDRGFRRGVELLTLGLRQEAKREFEVLRRRFNGDVLSMYRLALRLHDQEVYPLSMATAERLASLLGLGMSQAPRFLQMLAYPRPYRDLVESESARHGVDPLLFYALMRQESRFEPAAISIAGARGLTQVMPGTGQGIAKNLNWPNFKIDDLYKPYVSVAFGVYYLGEGLKQFRVPQLALAAYNGGPGNARRWQRIGKDVDLAVEAIDLSETALYVRTVTEQYAVYKSLYGAP